MQEPVHWPPAEGQLLEVSGLDPVKAAALANAVRAYPYAQINEDEGTESPTAEILAIAKEFEAYLTGQQEE